MRKAFFVGLSLLFIKQIANAMPCDYSYDCQSQSGKYRVVVGACIDNKLSLRKVIINNKTITQAKLGPAYDGTTGENEGERGTFAFQVNLPNKASDNEDDRRILTIEVPAQPVDSKSDSRKGIIRELFSGYNPAPFKVVAKEIVVCKDGD